MKVDGIETTENIFRSERSLYPTLSTLYWAAH